ncbi:hypothetical protein Hanom_Chr01g00005171 [Helianthus anomalus]
MMWRLKRSRLPDHLPKDFEFDSNLYAALIREAERIQKYQEHILVMGRISTIWSEPAFYPTLKWNGEFMGLKEALRLKSFVTSELDVRATKTPKGDPPYLTVVKENLYPIREPTVPVDQGGSAGQGGSGSAPSVRTVNLALVQVTSVAGDDRGKRTGSRGRRGPEDEVDQVTGFSAAGGLLGNLDAHLHGAKTPRDRPVTLPPSPLSFGGSATRVIDDVNMPDPQAFKKVNPSPSGKPTTGVASNISRPSPQQIDGGDSASSSPLWIVDALSAKMALFHLGTPAEHAFYRKMSGPELGNVLMLNQAQSNSLVVEAYKRWVEAESNCRQFEREIAFLKNEYNASAASAYEARDKAIRDLENVKLKFEELEKKLSEVEEKSKVEQKEMQSTYDQLLADHIRLVNGEFIAFFRLSVYSTSSPCLSFSDKLELERARDRAVESHQTMIADANGMLTRYDGEMVELYDLVSELMLTKQWFLTDGVAWVIKLVHQSPELEKVVADLVNSVNVVGVNDGIKQGFQAAKDSTRSVEEVFGYDEGAKDALDVAIKAFDNFHISLLDKVLELVDEPLLVIKRKSELPIVKEG